MQFRTEIHLRAVPDLLSHETPMLLMGSCFADEVGARLRQAKWPALVNPFGTLFNPLALTNLLARALAGEAALPEPGFAQRDGLHFHYDLPATFAEPSLADLRWRAGAALTQVGEWLHSPGPRCLVLTLGTAWVYVLKSTGQPVANCHKMPAAWFEKKLLGVEEIQQSLGPLLAQLPAGVRVVLTVSPVRHLKDTLPLNAVSKAALRLACHYLCEAHAQTSYFPAYELVIDDLRDYRFYAPDLLHPTPQAVDYVFAKFSDAYLDPAAKDFLANWASIRAALAHRPLHPGSKAHRQFLLDLLARLQALEGMDVTSELAQVRQWLADGPQS